MTDTDPTKSQSDHLILLVGGNPLPNAVAAQLLAGPTATIWLLHSGGSDGEPGTKKTAENLETFLRQKNAKWSIKLEPIPSADKLGIEQRVREILKKGQINGHIGLHYTGGTKSMSVHVYRIVEQILANSLPHPVFSYLDSNKLALRIDGHGTESEQVIPILKTADLRKKVEFTDLNQLAALHNYEPTPSNDENWGKSDKITALAEAIAQIHTDPKATVEWSKLRQQWRTIPKHQDFNLPDLKSYPSLELLIAALDDLCGGSGLATPSLVARHLLPDKPNPTLRACSKWLIGTWLEVYTASIFLGLSDNPPLVYRGTNLFYKHRMEKSDKFELDMAGIIGYQLFAISCIATAEKQKAKEHFLEVYVRAKQLGGDEARIGLVCLTENKTELENEIKRSWDAEGKVAVFGLGELTKLSQNLEDWFRQAN